MKELKLKIYDTTNTPACNPQGRPFIHVNLKGCFTINKAAAALLGLKHGEAVKLAQDENRPKDWYIIAGVSKAEGFVIRKKTDTTFQFNCKGLADLIFTSNNCAERAGRIGIGSEPLEHNGLTLHSLITGMLAAKSGKEGAK